MNDIIRKRFEETAEVIRLTAEALPARLAEAAAIIIESYRQGGRLLLFGNGGSASDAQHIAGEMMGHFLKDRQPFGATALSSDPSVVTCIANDYDYASIFARQVHGLGRRGDVAIGLSTSGNSVNVVRALEQARAIGMKTIAFTGKGGGKCAALADVLIDAPSTQTPRIQEAHVACYHILCELVEEALTNRD